MARPLDPRLRWRARKRRRKELRMKRPRYLGVPARYFFCHTTCVRTAGTGKYRVIPNTVASNPASQSICQTRIKRPPRSSALSSCTSLYLTDLRGSFSCRATMSLSTTIKTPNVTYEQPLGLYVPPPPTPHPLYLHRIDVDSA